VFAVAVIFCDQCRSVAFYDRDLTDADNPTPQVVQLYVVEVRPDGSRKMHAPGTLNPQTRARLARVSA
jgi:hypothetical protein